MQQRETTAKKEGCVWAPRATGFSPWPLAIDLRSTRRQKHRAKGKENESCSLPVCGGEEAKSVGEERSREDLSSRETSLHLGTLSVETVDGIVTHYRGQHPPKSVTTQQRPQLRVFST